jgi:hypothetical protein
VNSYVKLPWQWTVASSSSRFSTTMRAGLILSEPERRARHPAVVGPHSRLRLSFPDQRYASRPCSEFVSADLRGARRQRAYCPAQTESGACQEKAPAGNVKPGLNMHLPALRGRCVTTSVRIRLSSTRACQFQTCASIRTHASRPPRRRLQRQARSMDRGG